MTKYFKATFSDGFTAKRSTTSRNYTHAWRVGSGDGRYGFASSEQLAAQAAAGEYKWMTGPREVVAVEGITAKEYRSK